MSFSNATETNLSAKIFTATALPWDAATELDIHLHTGDPILSVPPGILDEKGNVKKKALGVIEVADGENAKPEYIVWDASLQSAFTEIEKLVDFLYLTAEISPDILGLGQGKSDSGKQILCVYNALKMKHLKKHPKQQRMEDMTFPLHKEKVIWEGREWLRSINDDHGFTLMPRIVWRMVAVVILVIICLVIVL